MTIEKSLIIKHYNGAVPINSFLDFKEVILEDFVESFCPSRSALSDKVDLGGPYYCFYNQKGEVFKAFSEVFSAPPDKKKMHFDALRTWCEENKIQGGALVFESDQHVSETTTKHIYMYGVKQRKEPLDLISIEQEGVDFKPVEDPVLNMANKLMVSNILNYVLNESETIHVELLK
jgi:hypothetical protein